jgi:ADP-ribose pyrophosphatase YjhB (NUDIX family)
MRPIPPEYQASRSWRVHVDGNEIAAVASVVITSDRFGTLSYGLTPLGHDGWSFREAGGGGVVILPYVWHDDELWIGLVRQDRPNQGGSVLNAPRGFIDAGESHDHGAARELAEEMAITWAAERVVRLDGELANPNSAFFETPHGTSGVHFYAIKLSPEELEVSQGRLCIRADLISRDRASAAMQDEQITDIAFLRWWEAATLADMFTNAAVARLCAFLHRNRLWRPDR